MAISKLQNFAHLIGANWWAGKQYLNVGKSKADMAVGEYPQSDIQWALNDTFGPTISMTKTSDNLFNILMLGLRYLKINDKRAVVEDDYIIETVTLASSVSFAADEVKSYSLPTKTGYTPYLLFPVVSGSWHDKFAVPMTYANGFGIWNRNTSEAFTWTVSANVLYVKNYS